MRFISLAGLGLAATCLAAPATAQVEALTLSNLTVTRYDTLPNVAPAMGLACCATHVFESGGDLDFIYIDADFSVGWTDDLERINISSRDIGLQIPTETEPRQSWGRFSFFPRLERGSTSLTARRPRDWPDENAGAYFNAVFAVPAGATEAMLRIGEGAEALQIPIDLNQPISELPSAASFFDVKADAISTTTELTTEDRLSGESISGRAVASAGQIVRLELTVTPNQNMDTDEEPGENTIHYDVSAFGLVGPEGLPLVSLGTSFSGSIRTNVSTSRNWEDEDDEAPEIDQTLFFLGSGAPGEYQIYFYDAPVGTITLE